jgi:hypothetical protein
MLGVSAATGLRASVEVPAALRSSRERQESPSGRCSEVSYTSAAVLRSRGPARAAAIELNFDGHVGGQLNFDGA